MRYLLSLLCLCISLTTFGFEQIDGQEASQRLELFDYGNNFILSDWEKKSNRMKYYIYQGTLETIHPQNSSRLSITFQYYQNKKNEKRPLVIISPTIGGQTILEKAYAQYLVKEGFNAVIANMDDSMTDESRPLDQLDNFSIGGIVTMKMLIDYFSTRPEIDPSKIVAIGTSLGGIRTSLAAGVEPRIKAAVTIVAGGDVPEILTTSQQKIVQKYRNARMEKENIANEELFKNRLETVIKIDPLFFTRFVQQENILMFIGDKDTSVPTKNQYDLWNWFSRPQYKNIPAGHVMTALMFPFYLRQIKGFFNARLANLPFELKETWFDKMYDGGPFDLED